MAARVERSLIRERKEVRREEGLHPETDESSTARCSRGARALPPSRS